MEEDVNKLEKEEDTEVEEEDEGGKEGEEGREGWCEAEEKREEEEEYEEEGEEGRQKGEIEREREELEVWVKEVETDVEGRGEVTVGENSNGESEEGGIWDCGVDEVMSGAVEVRRGGGEVLIFKCCKEDEEVFSLGRTEEILRAFSLFNPRLNAVSSSLTKVRRGAVEGREVLEETK
jgi:hypothetical protein